MRGILVEVGSIEDDDSESVLLIKARSVDVAEQNTLHAMYELLDCHAVDVVRLADDLDMWVDDEGMFGGVMNPLATFIAAQFGPIFQSFYGSVLFLGGANKRGDTVGLRPPREQQLNQLITELAITGAIESNLEN